MLNFLRQQFKPEHNHITSLLSAYVDGELAAKDRQRVEAHLARCDACAEDLRTLRYAKSLLAEAPMPRLPRSFVVRRADLAERPATAPRRIFGLRTDLVYAYLRGATAVVAVAFALVVAGDLIAQLGFGARQPGVVPAEEAYQETYVMEQRGIVGTTEVEQAAIEEAVSEEGTPPLAVVEEVVVEKEAEKVVIPTATPIPDVSARESTVSPSVEREALEGAVESLAVPEATPAPAAADKAVSPTEIAAAEPAYGEDESVTPTVIPTPVLPSPTPLPTATPSPRGLSIVPEGEDVGFYRATEGPRWPPPIRIAEVGLGGLALILLIVTLIVRRQQP